MKRRHPLPGGNTPVTAIGQYLYRSAGNDMSYTLSVPGDDSHLHELVHGIPPSTVDDGLTDNPVDLLTGELRDTIPIMKVAKEVFPSGECSGVFPCPATERTLELVALYQLLDRFGGDNHRLLHPQLPELNRLQLSKRVACYPVPIEALDDLLTWIAQGVDKVTSDHLAWERPCPSPHGL